MPGYDSTGPEGRGPFGRRLGPCAEGEVNTDRGFFFLRRGWRGNGRGYRWFQSRSFDSKSHIEAEKSWLEKRLDEVNQQIGKAKEDH